MTTDEYAIVAIYNNQQYILSVAYFVVENGGTAPPSGEIIPAGTITNTSGDKTREY